MVTAKRQERTGLARVNPLYRRSPGLARAVAVAGAGKGQYGENPAEGQHRDLPGETFVTFVILVGESAGGFDRLRQSGLFGAGRGLGGGRTQNHCAESGSSTRVIACKRVTRP